MGQAGWPLATLAEKLDAVELAREKEKEQKLLAFLGAMRLANTLAGAFAGGSGGGLGSSIYDNAPGPAAQWSNRQMLNMQWSHNIGR